MNHSCVKQQWNDRLTCYNTLNHKPHKIMTNFEPLATDLKPVPDENGTISWNQGAVMVALSAVPESIVDYVTTDYGHMIGERVDLGELNAWISDRTIDAIAELIFPTN